MPDESTWVDEIVVQGQRRKVATDPFPDHPGIESPDPETGGSTEGDGTAPISPCGNPVTRRAWDSDAAAAAAKAEFERRAAQRGEQLGHREYSAAIYQGVDGVVRLGPIQEGTIAAGSAPVDVDGLPPGSILLGFIHNHPGGGGGDERPSPGDWDVVDDWSVHAPAGGQGTVAANPLLYMIAATYPPSGGDPQWRIFVYRRSDKATEGIGPEVNPGGRPC